MLYDDQGSQEAAVNLNTEHQQKTTVYKAYLSAVFHTCISSQEVSGSPPSGEFREPPGSLRSGAQALLRHQGLRETGQRRSVGRLATVNAPRSQKIGCRGPNLALKPPQFASQRIITTITITQNTMIIFNMSFVYSCCFPRQQ